jgi:hypothetical protein
MKETKMRAYSLTELFCMTRAELFALHAQIVREPAALPDGSSDRPAALDLLRAIRRVLARSWPGP